MSKVKQVVKNDNKQAQEHLRKALLLLGTMRTTNHKEVHHGSQVS